MDKHNFNDLKSTLNNFQSSRRGLSQGSDVFANMSKLKKSIDDLEPQLKSQQVFIKKFFQTDQQKSQAEKAGEFKKQFGRFCEIFKNQFFEVMEMADNYFILGRKEKKESWVKIQKDFDTKINAIKQKADPTNFTEYLFMILNARDGVMKQLIRSILYRKELLWMDLGVTHKEYVHAQIKKIMQTIQTNIEQLGYAPTLIEFVPNFETQGRWSLSQQSTGEPTLPALFSIFNTEYTEVLQIVKNYAKLNESPQIFQDINKNQKVVKGLREKVEILSVNYETLLARYREANIKNEDKQDAASLRQKLDQYQSLLFQRDNQINEMKQEFNDSSSIIQNLRQKNRNSEAEITRIQNYEITKLRQLELILNTLNDEFLKIKKEVGNYSVMFKLENQSKKQISKQIDTKQIRIDKLVDILNRERRKIKTMESQIQRLNALIIELGGSMPG